MEKARETIEEIEEIKRAEMTTMIHRQSMLDSSYDHTGMCSRITRVLVLSREKVG